MNNSVDLILDDVPRMFHLEDANKFAKILKNADEVFVGFIEAINVSGECRFTHRMANGDVLESVIYKKSEALLDEIQNCYSSIFQEPKYPIIQNHVPLNVPLVDERQPPPKRKLFPLSEPKLKKLRSQLNVLVDSGRIVPSASPYGAPILFSAKKGGAVLRMCTEYQSLNSNMATDSFPLPRIDELLAHLCGSKVFSKLNLHDGYHQIPIAIRLRHSV